MGPRVKSINEADACASYSVISCCFVDVSNHKWAIYCNVDITLQGTCLIVFSPNHVRGRGEGVKITHILWTSFMDAPTQATGL